ncbi:MAG TPA: TRAP transporter permease [Methylomirabilota bacterium]|nr:TRAP transporter permease [Methylomirabilota bacterium]
MMLDARAARWMIGALAVALSIFHLWAGAFGAFESMLQRTVHLMTLLALCFLTVPCSPRLPARVAERIDLPLGLLALAIDAYLIVEHDRIVRREWYYGPMTTLDVLFGALTIVLVLEAARRTTGWPLPTIAGAFVLYALLGNHFPSPLTIRATDPLTLIDHMFLTPQAIFGTPTGASATFVYLFIVFGAFLQVTGGGRFFIDVAMAMVGRFTGGAAKVAVISSSLFGTISGHSVANVYGTGTFTIPLMKRFGYGANFAGAVEAAASTGGQIMPPVMGAAAFIMAEFLGVAYLSVMVAAILPACLFYLSVYLGVHNEAVKRGLRGVPAEEIDPLAAVLRRGAHFAVPLLVMLVLLFRGYTPFRAAFAAIVTLVAVALLRRATRIGPRQAWEALEAGARGSIMIATTVGCAGLIVGVLDLTGLGINFISAILGLSGGLYLPTLVLILLACFVLGMGMPTAPAYIIAALIGAPTLIQMGTIPMAAHMFVFYGALLSSITPPVALAAYAGAAIAGGDPFRTGLIAVRLGFVKLLVPFLFVYNPVLLWIGGWHEIVQATVTATVGVFALSYGFDGWLWGPVGPLLRAAFLVAGLALMVPELYTDLAGAALFVAIFALRLRHRRPLAAAPVPAE